MYHHPNVLAMTGASASTPALFGHLWLAIGLVTLLFAGLALMRLLPRAQR